MPEYIVFFIEKETFDRLYTKDDRYIRPRTANNKENKHSRAAIMFDGCSDWDVTPDSYRESTTKKLQRYERSKDEPDSPIHEEVDRQDHDTEFLENRMTELVRENQKLSAQNSALSEKLEANAAELDKARNDLNALKHSRVNADDYRELESYCRRMKEEMNRLQRNISDTEQRYSKAIEDNQRLQAEFQRLQDEATEKIEQLQRANESLGRTAQDRLENAITLEGENKKLAGKLEVASTDCARMKFDLDRYETLDLRGGVDAFLECISGMFNDIMDSEDISKIRDKAELRMENLVLNSEYCGFRLLKHERGTAIGNENILPTSEETGDESLDRTVKTCKKIGCDVKGFPSMAIDEKLVLWKYDPALRPAEPEPEKNVPAQENSSEDNIPSQTNPKPSEGPECGAEQPADGPPQTEQGETDPKTVTETMRIDGPDVNGQVVLDNTGPETKTTDKE